MIRHKEDNDMKKIISVLLALVMTFAFAPMTTYAEDIDFSSYDSIVALVNEVDKTPYTDDSYDALMASIVDRDSLTDQKSIDDATAVIATAYANLQKKTFSVEFFVIDSQDDIEYEKLSYQYGDFAELNVESEEYAYKWVASIGDNDTKLGVVGNSLSIAITGDVTITAFTDIAPEIKEQTYQIKFMAANGKIAGYAYTTDVNNFVAPEAPAVPFYAFDCWEKIDDYTYQAKYYLTAVCDGVHHLFALQIVKPTCYSTGHLIFICECGEGYRTDYVPPTGHNFSDDSLYCLNGCRTINPLYDEELPSNDEEIVSPSNPSDEPSIDEPLTPGIDEGGYSNTVIKP